MTQPTTDQHHTNLHNRLAGLVNDAISQDRALRVALAERNQAHHDLAQLKTHLNREQERLRGHITRTRQHRDQVAAERDKLVDVIARLTNLQPKAVADIHEVGYCTTPPPPSATTRTHHLDVQLDPQRLIAEMQQLRTVAGINQQHASWLNDIVGDITQIEREIHFRQDGQHTSDCPGCRIRAALDRPRPAGQPIPLHRAPDTDLLPWIRRAVADPGSIAGYRRGPHWPTRHEGWAEEAETLSTWTARAILTVIDSGGRPVCERCDHVIHVDDAYNPPLRGVGLWEHKGTCPADVPARDATLAQIARDTALLDAALRADPDADHMTPAYPATNPANAAREG
ncbi:hypothetical protein ACIA59_10530 [Micromonospora haikouensis]|uniref:hypothetical protein n=1 Tax=Micromonospora haikouensis TaxID=686309 RepID=UPI003789F8EA